MQIWGFVWLGNKNPFFFSRINEVLDHLIVAEICRKWKLKKIVKSFKIVSANYVYVTRAMLTLEEGNNNNNRNKSSDNNNNNKNDSDENSFNKNANNDINDNRLNNDKINNDNINALFEVTMERKRNAEFVINLSEIGRLDSYGNSSACVVDKFPSLKEFCFCSGRSRM